jgi:DNA-binding MarR family transcriptional regulator
MALMGEVVEQSCVVDLGRAIDEDEERGERTGYVECRPNPRERRSRLAFLTGRGASVPQVTHAAAARVEERRAELTSRSGAAARRGWRGYDP